MTSDRALREDFSFAFQPIVNVDSHEIWAYEALVRGPNNESATQVLDQFAGDSLLAFDQRARLRALRVAAKLGYTGSLSLNMLTGSPERDGRDLAETLTVAAELGFGPHVLKIEISEKDAIADLPSFLVAIRPSRALGALFALDDFGAGYSGLNLLAGFQPNFIKLDKALVNEVSKQGPRQAIVRGVMSTSLDLGIEVIAEGVEQIDDFQWLYTAGVRLYQGYLFARPSFERLPEPVYPALTLQ